MMNKQTILITRATGFIGGGAAVALAKRGGRVVEVITVPLADSGDDGAPALGGELHQHL